MAHPQHPLNGKIVKVLGQASGHWIIQRPDGSPEKLPLAWAEALPAIIPSTHSPEPWAGVTELLNLVKILNGLHSQPPEKVDDEGSFLIVSTNARVQRIQPPEEVDDECQPGNHTLNQPSAGEPSPGHAPHPALGANSGRETPGTDPGSGGSAGQATSEADSGGEA